SPGDAAALPSRDDPGPIPDPREIGPTAPRAGLPLSRSAGDARPAPPCGRRPGPPPRLPPFQGARPAPHPLLPPTPPTLSSPPPSAPAMPLAALRRAPGRPRPPLLLRFPGGATSPGCERPAPPGKRAGLGRAGTKGPDNQPGPTSRRTMERKPPPPFIIVVGE